MITFKRLLLFFFLISSCTVKGQFKIDTLSEVNITSKRISAKPFFSTFSKRLFFKNQLLDFTSVNYRKDSIDEFIYPIVIQVENNTNHKIKLDSLLIKSTNIDTSKVTIFFEVFQSGKRVSISKLKIANRGKKLKLCFLKKTLICQLAHPILALLLNVISISIFDFMLIIKSKVIFILIISREMNLKY